MARDDRFYAFIIAHTSRSKARVQRIRIEKKVVTSFFAAAAVLTVGLCYGLYGLTQHAAHLRTDFENQRLRAENERQRIELEKLNNRVEKVEDTSRKPAAKSGMPRWQDRLFIRLARSANDATDYFQIPTGRVVEIGTQVTI